LCGHGIPLQNFINGRIETIFYETSVLEWFRGPQGGKNLSEASYRPLLDFPFHFQLQKVEVVLSFDL
jgi:hypothetical protein